MRDQRDERRWKESGIGEGTPTPVIVSAATFEPRAGPAAEVGVQLREADRAFAMGVAVAGVAMANVRLWAGKEPDIGGERSAERDDHR